MRLLGSVPLRLGKYVRLSRTRCDQFAEIAIYERTPAARAISVAFEFGHQAYMRKTKFGLAAPSGNIKDDVGADPLALVFDKGQFGIRDVPHNLLARSEFRNALCGGVNVLVLIDKFGVKPV